MGGGGLVMGLPNYMASISEWLYVTRFGLAGNLY